jgi:hypothetical protein
MITARDILWGVVLPAGVAAAAVLLGALFGRRWRLRRAMVPLGIGIGFSVGFAALVQRVPPAPPLDSVDWLFYAAVVVGALGAIDSFFWDVPAARDGRAPPDARVLDYARDERRAPRKSLPFALARFAVVLALSAVLVWLLVRPLLVFNWTGSSGYLRIALVALLMSLMWLALDALAARAGGRTMALGLAIVAALSALTVMLSGSQKLGQLGGLLTSALFAAAVLGLFFPSLLTARGMVLVYVMLHTSLALTASEHVYASLTTLNAILLLIAAPLGWICLLLPARRLALRAAAQVVAMVVPAAAAAILAALAFARAAQDYSDFPS